MNAQVIGSEHILLALIHDKRAMDSEILRQIKDDYLNFDISIQSFGGESPASPIADLPVGSDNDEESSAPGKESKDQSSQKSSGKGSHKSDTPALDKYGYDMTRQPPKAVSTRWWAAKTK